MKLIHSSQFRSFSMEIGKRNILSKFLNMTAKDVVKKSTPKSKASSTLEMGETRLLTRTGNPPYLLKILR